MLVLDRLSALMVVLTAVLALVVVLYAIGSGWDARGAHFHALFQFQLMGLGGAFLTGDVFNLFVFFEVLLIASYGLMIHAGGGRGSRAGVQYVAFNLVGSTLFLFALATIYARDRHAQHGRPRGEGAALPDGRHGADPGRRGAAAARLRDQGRAGAAAVLAARHLCQRPRRRSRRCSR